MIRVEITDHGRIQLRKATEMLIKDDPESITTDRDFAVHVEEFRYNPTREYSGGHKFKKHAFDLIGDMNKKELETATIIDSHPNVKRWLRNLDHESHGGFWLPKSPGKFFPDFIVELLDGTIVIVEYKNAKLASNPDEQHKRDIGELWRNAAQTAIGSHGWLKEIGNRLNPAWRKKISISVGFKLSYLRKNFRKPVGLGRRALER